MRHLPPAFEPRNVWRERIGLNRATQQEVIAYETEQQAPGGDEHMRKDFGRGETLIDLARHCRRDSFGERMT